MAKPITCKACGSAFFIRDKDLWHKERMKCPDCGIIYAPLPDTERILRDLQDQYFWSGRDEKYISQIYAILHSYSISMILDRYSEVVSTPELLDYHAHQSATFVVEEFCKDPEFKVRISFGGYLINKIKQSIFGKKEHTIGDISIDHENQNGMFFQLPDENEELESIDISSREELADFLGHLIFDFSSIINGTSSLEPCNDLEELDYRRLMAIMVYLDRGEEAYDRHFKSFGPTGKMESIKTLGLVKSEILTYGT